MAAGCSQKHGYICEIDPALTPTISTTEIPHTTSSHSPLSNSIFNSPEVSTYDMTIKPSFSDYYTPGTSVSSLYSITTLLPNAPAISSTFQVSPTLTPTYGNISPTKGQTISDLNETMTTTSHRGPIQVETRPTSGNQATYQNNCSIYCDKYISSLTMAELIKILTNVSLSDKINASKPNESLLLNAKQTGRAKRKLTSAPDTRYSSRAIGGLAVVIITFVPACFVVVDLPKFLNHLKMPHVKTRTLG